MFDETSAGRNMPEAIFSGDPNMKLPSAAAREKAEARTPKRPNWDNLANSTLAALILKPKEDPAIVLEEFLRGEKHLRNLDQARLKIGLALQEQGKLTPELRRVLQKGITDNNLRRTLDSKEPFNPNVRLYELDDLGGTEIKDTPAQTQSPRRPPPTPTLN